MRIDWGVIGFPNTYVWYRMVYSFEVLHELLYRIKMGLFQAGEQ